VADNQLMPGGVEFGALPDDPAAAHGLRTPGDHVEARHPRARVGLSGNTDFVHLHYQLQGGPDPRLAEGLPTRFADIGRLQPGTIVESS
jgi:hypothetical protein